MSVTSQCFKSAAAKGPELSRIPTSELQNFRETIHELKWNELLSGVNLVIVQNTIKQCTRKIRHRRIGKRGLPWFNVNIRKTDERVRSRKELLKLNYIMKTYYINKQSRSRAKKV